MDEWRKADKQNKQMENSKEKDEHSKTLEIASETETANDLKEGEKKSCKDLSPKKETNGAKSLKSTSCDLKHEPAGGGGIPAQHSATAGHTSTGDTAESSKAKQRSGGGSSSSSRCTRRGTITLFRIMESLRFEIPWRLC